jgi:hypothetical protein
MCCWNVVTYKWKVHTVRNSCVEDREVKCVNAIAGGDGPILYVF